MAVADNGIMVRSALLCASLVLAAAAVAEAQSGGAADRLRAAGIEPTLDGVRGYLESLLDPARDKQVDAWIADLGNADYAVRERASLRLAQLDFVAAQKLQAATNSPDPERAWRAKLIQGGRAESGPLLAALRLVEEQQLPVGVPLLLRIRTLTASPALQVVLMRAMLAIVTESDRAALASLDKSDDQALRGIARRLLSRLDGPGAAAVAVGDKIEAVKLRPGQVSGGGRNLVDGWEFRPKADIVVTDVGLYDAGGDGLASAHEIAIWDVEEPATPLVQETIFRGQSAPLVGSFRFVPTTPVKLLAGHHYAIVAHFPDGNDPTVGLINPTGLSIEYAEQIETLGRRYAFPHDTMAFPGKLTEGEKHAKHGPTFRFRNSGVR
jgi:hypothetical protein